MIKFNRRVGGKYFLSFSPVSLDPKEILRALRPGGPHQPGLWGENSSPVLPQLPPLQAGQGCSAARVASSRDTYVNNVIFNRGDKGRKHHRKLADSKERKEEEVSLY